MAFKTRGSGQKRHFVLNLEAVEERLAPAVLPTPTVVTPTAAQSSVALPANGPVNFINPQVVADPTNPDNQVLVATSVTSNTTFGVIAEKSTDGGQSWSVISGFQAQTSTGSNPGGFTLIRDPALPATAANNTYTNASGISAAFGRNGMVYFTYLATNAADTSGAVEFQEGTFASGSVGALKTIYQWIGANSANNPVIAVDNNVPTYTDPTTGTTFTDTMDSAAGVSKAVYIAWNGNATAGASDLGGSALSFNPNPILAAVSPDNGTTWSQPVPVNNGGYLPATTAAGVVEGAAPQIAFSPAGSGAPGSLVFAWPSMTAGSTYSSISYDVTRPDGGVPSQTAASVVNTAGTTGAIADAAPAVPPAVSDTPSQTTFTQTVTASQFTDPNFTLADLSVSLSVVAQSLDQLSIVLTAPSGQSITLLDHRTNSNGSTQGMNPVSKLQYGVSPPPATPTNPYSALGLGVDNGDLATSTVFNSDGALRISDPNATFPYIGVYRPEDLTLGSTIAAQLGIANATPSQVKKFVGLWTLTVTDYKHDTTPEPESLNSWSLNFISGVKSGFGADATIPGAPGTTNTTAAGNPIATATSTPIGPNFNSNPLTSFAVSPTAGIPSAVTIAFDPTLGSADPYAGQFYVGYTSASVTKGVVTDTNIEVASGVLGAGGAVTWNAAGPVRVNDDSASDNLTQGNRPQLIPSLTVDSTTGTLVVTWYDTRLDASDSRAATYIATSIDGGQTFSSQTFEKDAAQPFLNQPQQAEDVVTGTTYTLGPIPTNISQAGPNGVGIRQSVIAAGGRIYAYWAGNANATGSGIFSATAETAAGPRVVSGDLGAVTTASTVAGFDQSGNAVSTTYNTSIATDGTRGIDAFVVTFDRPLDPNQFATMSAAQLSQLFQVKYRNPYASLAIPATAIGVSSVDVIYQNDPADNPVHPGVPYGPTQLLVHLTTPQFAVGTYSYAVGPGITDQVAAAATGAYALSSTSSTPYPAASGGGASVTPSAPLPVSPSVPAGAVVTGVTVTLNVSQTGTMPDTTDLVLTLIAPDGTRITLSSHESPGSTAPNFTNTTFSAGAGTAIAAGAPPFTGTFVPDGNLLLLNGKAATGSWELEVQNSNPFATGTLTSWGSPSLTSRATRWTRTRTGLPAKRPGATSSRCRRRRPASPSSPRT
ncbi:Fibronectin type III domain protein [Fimbriiglobus ruber]|uniref:Fibronectin type III domain protein n=2 Tax=Fimbriiglobus ruber TaxID=1908690 RepID=A0A225DRS3_9BACT|nr:Fibronectin type III domain protein [Fimbriiglobus ruber]